MDRRSLLLALGFSPIAFAAKADLYDDYINSISKQPFVSFMARGPSTSPISLAGHAFVAVGTELDNGELFYEAIFGFYPDGTGAATDVKMILSTVPGVLKFTWPDLAADTKYRVNVTSDQKAAALAAATQWTVDHPNYNLFANGGMNCNAFAAAVAAAIGLTAPSAPGTTLPVAFIQALKAMNN
jgi:hypothetical protein